MKNFSKQVFGTELREYVCFRVQPRRIAALALSRRVADQLHVQLGTSVGYRIGQGDHLDSKNSLITFVTVGYMLQYLAHNPSMIDRYTHLVLDEVHERSMDMDLLNLVIKKLLQTSATKIVVMSATLQSGLFGEYFTPSDQMVGPSIFVGARRFPVEKIYLNDMLSAIPAMKKTFGSTVCKLITKFDSSAAESLAQAEVSQDMQRIVCHMVLHLARADECLLIFLPGIGEIGEIQDKLELLGSVPVPLQVLILHSSVPKEEQDLVMLPAQQGHCKIILSTNIAESSITIPDVRVVLDLGLQRSITFDDKRRMSALTRTWYSQSSATQRAGRAGRVAPGRIFYLYTQSFHARMREFEEAEINRVPLEKTVLQVKMLLSSFGTVTQLLSQALTAPPHGRVQFAIKNLFEAGAITLNDESAEVTQLGLMAASLPVDLGMVKLILLGNSFRCVADAIVIAATLSLQDIFAMPSRIFLRDQKQYIESLSHNLKQRLKYDNGCYSEPLAYLAAYKDWLLSDKKQHSATICGMSHSRMTQLDMFVADLCRSLDRFHDAVHCRGRCERERERVLDRLHDAALRRGRCDPLESRELKTLFCSDLNLLQLIITGACAPLFLDGEVMQCNWATEEKLLGLAKNRTIAMSKSRSVPLSEQILDDALRAVSLQASSIQNKGDKFLVEMGSRDTDPRPPSLESTPLVRVSQKFGQLHLNLLL
jgi:HrpA-like RNA helicase